MTFVPVLSILAGRRLAAGLVAERWLSLQWTKLQATSLTVLNMACGITLSILALNQWPEARWSALYAVVVIGVGFSTIAWLFRWQRQKAGVLVGLTCYTLYVMVFFGEIQPVRDPKRSEVSFNQQVREKFPDTKIIGYEMGVVSSYYLGPNYWYKSSEISVDDLQNQLTSQESVIVVAKSNQEDELKQYGTLAPIMKSRTETKLNKNGKQSQIVCWEFTPYQALRISTQADETKRQ